MLKVESLNKYYFKNKSNEIHVLNNINLEFKEKGLYFLLGPSGSGKSTLLNTIGLLDSFDNGKITIEDKEFNKYRNVDDVRNLYFGYVFQNYLLNEEKTVYENLEIVLKLINYKGDYYKRVEEVLHSLNMDKYIKRKAKDLSGGQKQRIGIARCLIKSPKIILMDEPTGNLDEKNSIQVMEIVKNLAKDCLIIVVSHDENLAKAYGDYIIRLKDGSIISEEINNEQKSLDVNDPNTIYLKDYKNESINNINIYSNNKIPNLNIIIDHNKIYVQGEGDIEVINSKSPLKLVNEHKEVIKKEKKENLDIHISKIETKESKHVLSSWSLFKQAFKSKYKRVTTIAFFITSIIFASSIPFLSSLDEIDPSSYVESNSNVYEWNSIVEKKDLKDIISGNDLILDQYTSNNLVKMVNDDFTKKIEKILYASYVPITDNLNIVKGSKSDNMYDIYIDESIINKLSLNYNLKSLGLFDEDDFIGREVIYQYGEFVGHIAGIVRNNEPSIYVNPKLLMLDEFIFSTDVVDNYQTTSPLENNKLLVNEKYKDEYSDTYENYPIVGTFTSPYDITFLTNKETYEDYYFNKSHATYRIYSEDISRIEKELNVSFTNFKEIEIEEYYFTKRLTIISSISFIILTLSISLIFLFFIMKSSLIHRIKEVGIYRSIGVKKFDIYKIFGSEIMAIVTRYSLPGYLLCVLGCLYLHSGNIISSYNLLFVPLGILIYYVLAVLIGLIPVSLLMKKTPSEINKKYDI